MRLLASSSPSLRTRYGMARELHGERVAASSFPWLPSVEFRFVGFADLREGFGAGKGTMAWIPWMTPVQRPETAIN